MPQMVYFFSGGLPTAANGLYYGGFYLFKDLHNNSIKILNKKGTIFATYLPMSYKYLAKMSFTSL